MLQHVQSVNCLCKVYLSPPLILFGPSRPCEVSAFCLACRVVCVVVLCVSVGGWVGGGGGGGGGGGCGTVGIFVSVCVVWWGMCLCFMCVCVCFEEK